ncbi:MAG: hypothetical protein WAV79_03215, partial [Anaerolineae bacterium]
ASMSSLKLGFVLEGNSDYPVIPCLARRVVAESFPVIALASDSEAIRLPVLRQRCPHFDEFARNLIVCVREWQRLQLQGLSTP